MGENAVTSEEFSALGPHTEFWVVSVMGGWAFRFGPYTGPECGEHIKRALEEGVSFNVVVNCGRQIDWKLLHECTLSKDAPEQP